MNRPNFMSVFARVKNIHLRNPIPKSPSSQRVRREVAPRRFIVILLLVGAFAFGLVVQTPSSATKAKALVASGAAPSGVLSSAWYCGVVPSKKTESASGVITMANPNDVAITGVATIAPTAGEAKDVPISMAPNSRAVIKPGAVVDAPFSGVMLRFEGGGVAVEHTARTEFGSTTAPCATKGSHTWYLTDTTTQTGASLKLAIFNPFDQDAIINGEFPTDNDVLRPATPTNLDGMIVKARSLVVVELGENLFRRDWISGKITTRSGRVVVEALQSGAMFGGRGVALIAAAPELSDTWYIPQISVLEGQSARVSVFNPADRDAAVRVTIINDGDVDPFELMIPARSREKLDFPTDRLPKGSEFSAVVRIVGDSPKVAVQLLGANAAPAVPPGSWSKLATTVSGKRIVFPVGDTSEPADERITVVNVGKSPTTVRIRALSDNGTEKQLAPLELAPSRRTTIRIDEQVPTGNPTIDLQADQPLIATRTQTSTASGLIDVTPGAVLRK